MRGLKVKVCGMKYPENISGVAQLGPNYMGFICYGKSPRYVDDLQPQALQGIPQEIIKTGVFVNETAEEINRKIDIYGFEAVQLHGTESAALCRQFKGRVTVLKAFGIDGDFDFSVLTDYYNAVDYFLFDTKTPAHGGSGKTFNWQVLQNYTGTVPFFLSGGIGPENVTQAASVKHPQFAGLDLNSRFETAAAMKDIEALEKAFETIKKFDNHEIRS